MNDGAPATGPYHCSPSPRTSALHGLRCLCPRAGHARAGHAVRPVPDVSRRCRGHAEPGGALRLPAGGDPGLRAAPALRSGAGGPGGGAVAAGAGRLGGAAPAGAVHAAAARRAGRAADVHDAGQYQLHRLSDDPGPARRRSAAVCGGLRPVRHFRDAFDRGPGGAGALRRRTPARRARDRAADRALPAGVGAGVRPDPDAGTAAGLDRDRARPAGVGDADAGDAGGGHDHPVAPAARRGRAAGARPVAEAGAAAGAGPWVGAGLWAAGRHAPGGGAGVGDADHGHRRGAGDLARAGAAAGGGPGGLRDRAGDGHAAGLAVRAGPARELRRSGLKERLEPRPGGAARRRRWIAGSRLKPLLHGGRACRGRKNGTGPAAAGPVSRRGDGAGQKRYWADTPYRLALPSNGPTMRLPLEVMSTRGSSGFRWLKAKLTSSWSLTAQVAPIEYQRRSSSGRRGVRCTRLVGVWSSAMPPRRVQRSLSLYSAPSDTKVESLHSNGSTASGSGLSNSMRTSRSDDQPVSAKVAARAKRSLTCQWAPIDSTDGVVRLAPPGPSWKSGAVIGLAPNTAATLPGTVQSALPRSS